MSKSDPFAEVNYEHLQKILSELSIPQKKKVFNQLPGYSKTMVRTK